MYYRAKNDVELPWFKIIKKDELLDIRKGILYYNDEPICSEGTYFCRECFEPVEGD